MKHVTTNTRLNWRRGTAVILTVLTLPVIFAFAAMTIDIGTACVVHSELQRAADAAALAGAGALGGVDPNASMQAAVAATLDYVRMNPTLNDRPVDFNPTTDLVFGQARLQQGGTKVEFLPNALPASAVQVTVRYELDYSFAAVFGRQSRTISATATAATGPRDFVIVIDCSGSMTRQSIEAEVAADLDALGIPYDINGKQKNPVVKAALSLTYDGSDPEFAGVYAIGEQFLPPSIRIQPLKATKDAAAYSVGIVENAGYDDLVGAVAYATGVAWVEPLTTNSARVRAKLRGATKYGGTSLHEGIRAAREELQSARTRPLADKVIVLMTDGRSDSTLALEQAQLAVDAGMTVHCIGLGLEVDRALLDAIAALSGGLALYVDNNTDSSVYGPELARVFQSVADEVGHWLIK